MCVRVIALLLAALPVRALAQEDEEPVYRDPEQGNHVRVIAWGGTLVDLQGKAPAAAHAGGEVAYSLDTLDLGVLAEGYHLGDRARTPWTPVVLARLNQRFETRKGLEAAIGFGVGAGRTQHWVGWYQLALGLRLAQGPLFLAGEVGFERLNLFRLSAGVGVRF